jgi:hypothetical protein
MLFVTSQIVCYNIFNINKVKDIASFFLVLVTYLKRKFWVFTQFICAITMSRFKTINPTIKVFRTLVQRILVPLATYILIGPRIRQTAD